MVGGDRQSLVFALVLLGSAILFFVALSNRDLFASHEARAAQNAQLSLDNHDWGVLHLFDGSPDYQKPPLFYWLVAAVTWLCGGQVDAFAVRFPVALAGWSIVLLVMQFLRSRGRPTAAIIAGLTLTTAQHFLSVSRIGRIDVPLTAAVTVCIFALMKERWLVAAIAIGAALLLKGPIGIIIPIVVCLLARNTNKGLPRMPVGLTSILIGIVIAAPWYIAVGFQTRWEFWRVFFWYHNVQRAAGTSDELARHPVWFYLIRWVIDWLPWSPGLVVAVFIAIRRQLWRVDKELRLGLVWVTAVSVLLSCSRFKRADYLILAYPGAAILLGCVGERTYLKINEWNQVRLRRLAMVSLFATIGVYIGMESIYMPQVNEQYPQSSFATVIRQHARADQTVVFFRVEDHLLTYHVQPPLVTVMEWENLDVWIKRLVDGWIVLPEAELDTWPESLKNGTLHEVARLVDAIGRERPRTWVLMRSRANE